MSESSRSPDALRDAQQNARRLMIDGSLWLVYELPPLTFDRRSTPSLVFESADAIRRVRGYPPEWRTLSDENLFALSWAT